MPQIFDVTANKIAHYKPYELENIIFLQICYDCDFITFLWYLDLLIYNCDVFWL